MESWELTEYERQREPQDIGQNSEIAIAPRSLLREIICPICLDQLSETRAAPDCLHRFCKKCIDKAVKKECPICRKKLPSQTKSFRQDPKFDHLIAKVCSGYRSKPRTETQTNNSISKNNSNLIAAPECEIVLKQIIGQQTRYIKCPDNTTVNHLTRYLAIRPEGSNKMPDLDNNEEFKLSIVANPSEGHYEMLPGNLTLDQIKSKYKLNSDKPLELYFHNPNER